MKALRATSRLLRLAVRHPSSIRDFGRLARSLSSGSTALADRIPWVTFDALRWLERYVNQKSRVFEWGSGGSTLFFASRAQSVIAIEHDAQWHSRVLAAISEGGANNCRCELMPPQPLVSDTNVDEAIPGRYRSGHLSYANCHFRQYCRAIEQFVVDEFDVISVDGRARTSCIFHARQFLAKGGALILDNAERERYCDGIRLMDQYWKRLDFHGPGPYSLTPWTTIVWINE